MSYNKKGRTLLCVLLLAALAGCRDAAKAPRGAPSSAAQLVLVPHRADTRTLGPGAAFDDCAGASWCPRMIALPAGLFIMGSPADEPGRLGDEGPRHEVKVGRFAIGAYEVTFQEWEACVRDGGCGGFMPDDNYRGRRAHPVYNVSWTDANAYARWLSRKVGAQYRLPTEAEWEYAARAGSSTAFNTGATIAPTQAQYNWGESYRGALTAPTQGAPAPVGSFAPNAWGLYDMHGNIAEWVEDCWSADYATPPPAASARECVDHDVRGGSWFDEPSRLRSARRDRTLTATRARVIGFRVAREIP